jgi:hypothetical protein
MMTHWPNIADKTPFPKSPFHLLTFVARNPSSNLNWRKHEFKHPLMGVKRLTVGSQFEFHSARRPSVMTISYTALGNDGL